MTEQPTEQEWRELYRAADAFKKLAPWEWMLDSDIFGVRNPETGEIGYGCVMGNLGEHFALGLYLGDEGLRGLEQIRLIDQPSLEALFTQHCLMASFEDREVLSKRDREQIKALGLKYRGRSAWPHFLSYTPGYVPWYLTGPEARFLTVALQQACHIAQRFRADNGILVPPTDDQVLVRVFEDGAWHDRWHSPDLSVPLPPPPPPLDEVAMQRIRTMETAREGTWESDSFFTMQEIQEDRDQRPYYARLILVVDQATAMIFPPEISGPETWREEYQQHVLNLIASSGIVPQEILVPSPELRDVLAPIAEALTIKLRISRDMPALEMVRDSIMTMF